uniref:Inner membrane protein forms channel for type IVsecretion of T-DNA complex (VirB10) n=2 Tax=Vibrionaceae TaxID=641 RepID=A0A0H3ZSR8_VIBSP|nr:Inner membrane protein forms channel for type IVsecretion of T-DNA complex (VirB10) [Vibrio splendidus]AKN40556.1 Inner membrane protein of type IV secretion of T-DNA complex, TonB-like, VirB10 [Enterovibrio norvegicus]
MSLIGNLNPNFEYTRLALIIGGAIAVVGGGYYAYQSLNLQKPKQYTQQTEKSGDVTNLFYSRPDIKESDVYLLPSDQELAELQAAEEERKAAEKATQYKIPEIVTETKTRTKHDERQRKIEEKYTKEQLFVNTQPTPQQLREERRQQLLASRRAKSSTWSQTIDYDAIEAKEKETKKPSDKDYSEHEIGKDTSTYPVDLTRTITADRYIDCAVKEQINSQLEGRVVCQVVNDVYGAHGRKILIPAGSTAIGQHTTLKKVGDERFNVVWQRIIRAGDGVHIKLTEAYSSDRIGSSGVGGIVDNRMFEKYGGAVLTSSISAIAQISIPVKSGSITNSVIQSYGTDLGQVTAALINEGINIKPFSILPAGTIIKITPTTDIWLKHFDKKNGAVFAPVEE